MVPKGAVLFTSRAPIGYVAIAGVSMCTNQGFKNAIPGDDISSEFVYWQLQNLTEDIRSRASGTTFLEISGKGFAATKMLVPPLTEQNKIVEILEEQFSRLDAALTSVRAVREKSVRFRRSLLHAAFTGALTGHESLEIALRNGWSVTSIGAVAALENGDRGKNYPNKSTLVTTGKPFVNAGHLENGRIDIPNVSYISGEHFDILRSGKFSKGDILFCLRGSLGKCAIVREDLEGAIASSLVIVRPSEKVNTEYLFRFLESPIADAEMKIYDNGTAQPNLASKNLARFEIAIPTLKEQERIVTILDEQLSRLDASLAVADAIEKKAVSFRRSLLHAAFSGDLTKEWREGAHV
jgi:type I restriction enzyme S subunit